MNKHSDDMDIDFLFGQLALIIRRGAAGDLLRGNDTGCFTTEQYLDAYLRHENKMKDPGHKSIISLKLAEMHLRSIPETVREVRSGVWAGTQ